MQFFYQYQSLSLFVLGLLIVSLIFGYILSHMMRKAHDHSQLKLRLKLIESQWKHCDQEKEELSQQLQRERTLSADAIEQLNGKEKEISNLREQIETLSLQPQDSHDDCVSSSYYFTLCEELRVSKAKVVDLQQLVVEKQRSIDTVSKRLAGVEMDYWSSIPNLERRWEQSDARVSKLSTELKIAETELTAKEDELRSLINEKQVTKLEHINQMHILEDKNTKLSQRIVALERELEATKAELSQHDAAHVSLRGECFGLTLKSEALSRDLEEARRALEESAAIIVNRDSQLAVALELVSIYERESHLHDEEGYEEQQDHDGSWYFDDEEKEGPNSVFDAVHTDDGCYDEEESYIVIFSDDIKEDVLKEEHSPAPLNHIAHIDVGEEEEEEE